MGECLFSFEAVLLKERGRRGWPVSYHLVAQEIWRWRRPQKSKQFRLVETEAVDKKTQAPPWHATRAVTEPPRRNAIHKPSLASKSVNFNAAFMKEFRSDSMVCRYIASRMILTFTFTHKGKDTKELEIVKNFNNYSTMKRLRSLTRSILIE